MTHMPQTSLVAVRCYKPEVTAAVLTTAHASNRQRIGKELPDIPQQFGSFEMAIATLVRLIYSSQPQDQHAWVVIHDGVMTGLATAQYKQLIGRGYQNGRVLLSGPLLQVWLAKRDRRPWGTRLLPVILKLLAVELAEENIPGTPWALVRPELHYCISCLTNEENGFGGFYAPRTLSDYTRVDGNPALRTLFIPNGIQLPC